jgi:hypothetical protein
MICPPCRGNRHHDCPELARQLNPLISKTDKIGSSKCYCAHESGSVLRPDRQADPRRGA